MSPTYLRFGASAVKSRWSRCGGLRVRGLWTSDGEGPPGDNRRMTIRVWEYDVQEVAAADFERIYGADGAWAQLFSSSDGSDGPSSTPR